LCMPCIINTGTRNAYEQAVIGMIAPNTYLFHHFLKKHNFLFMSTFSGTQLGHKIRAMCIQHFTEMNVV
jgi:hypothetical protein